MAFEASRTGYIQMDPTFIPGYPYPSDYHNVGQLQTPYEGKYFGQGGDYGPPQDTRYYTVQNPNYPYVLDRDFRAEQFIPTRGCCFPNQPGYTPCAEERWPDYFVPPNYFAPDTVWPSGHASPSHPSGPDIYSGTRWAYSRTGPPKVKTPSEIETQYIEQGLNVQATPRLPSLRKPDDVSIPITSQMQAREGYQTSARTSGYNQETGAFPYEKLATANAPLRGSKDYPPFNRFY